MFVNDLYTLVELVEKFGLTSDEVECGLRRTGAKTVIVRDPEDHPAYSYESVWTFVHRHLNHEHFAAWQHNSEMVSVSEMTDTLSEEVTEGWPKVARLSLLDLLKSANGSSKVQFLRRRIMHIDPECPDCGRFPWIVGFDDRKVHNGVALSIYVCPGCGYLFLKR